MARNFGYEVPPTAQRAQPPQERHPQAPHPQAPHPQAPRPQEQPPQAPRPRPQHPLGFDPASWPIIRQSAARLARDQGEFIRQLHSDVTSLLPDLAGTPGAGAPGAPGAPALDLWMFCGRMAHALLWVALTDQPLGVIADMLREVGAQNWLEGFPDSQYVTVAHALVQTVHYLTEDDWSASMGSVWISYFMWVKPHLLAGAQQAAAAHRPPGRHARGGDPQPGAGLGGELGPV